MPDHLLERRLVIGRSRPDVFAFFADPETPVRLSPPWLAVRLIVAPPVVTAGAVLDYRIGPGLRWRVVIREFDPPYRFVDVQVRGPLARWEHRRRFLEDPRGTLVEDRVVYQLPLGALGQAVHAAAGARALEALWNYRTRRIAALLGPVSSRPGA